MESERGLDFVEDLFQPFVLHYDLNTRPQTSLIASLEPREVAAVAELHLAELDRRKAVGGKLASAADQFIVKRGNGHSIIAGYPWFADWGRDTMISLPGLTLCTARSALAKEILQEFSEWIRDGMLPNTLPDQGEQPQYNSVDASLWYVEAVRAYAEATGDYDWVFKKIYGALSEIIDAYIRGTRYHIRLDSDGLVHAGEPGLALTWMDARPNGVPSTPRAGKPVEIQALWYNALRIMESFSARLDSGRKDYYASLAESTRATFRSKFWNGSESCLFDVVERDGGGGNDAAIRPNQVFAISLPHKLLEPVAARQVLAVVERELLTPFGLRTLSPKDPHYRGTYSGDVESRDSAYHQGTVWPWLMGPFVVAHFEAYGRDAAARQRCLDWLSALKEYRTSEGMNQLPELFDGDPPHRAGGCPAQAWSLASIIESFRKVY
jgi:predicted glycogen debranching enzyme